MDCGGEQPQIFIGVFDGGCLLDAGGAGNAG
jgi:hypothetical protein